LTAIKGVRALVEAMPAVLKRHPNAKLLVLGQGELEQTLTQLATHLGVGDAVKFRFEFVPEEERIMHYAASDLCVFPSTYEPFGIVSLEAMAMAKPVIVGASGVVGFKEQVVPNGPEQCGVHINGADAADIAWGIGVALEDRERARRWGLAGRKRAKEHFSWDQAARETLKHYERLRNQGA
jgi:glycosyltransferase involved in cell wall biosynthesis